jgi:hypothetical protein
MNNPIEIYYILPIIFFGLIVSLSILSPLYKDKQKKRRSLSFIIKMLVLNVLISGGVYWIFGLISEKQKNKIEQKQGIDDRIRDSIQINIDKQKIELDERTKRDSISRYLQAYYDAYCVNDSTRLDSFYSYPLDRYYTLSNVSKQTVHERTSFDNFTHRYPNCKIRKDKILINKLGGDTIEVIIELKQIQNRKYFTNFLLGKDMKIFSVISTISVPDLSDDKEEKRKKKKK